MCAGHGVCGRSGRRWRARWSRRRPPHVVVLPSGDGPGPALTNAAELLTRAAAAAGDGRDIEPRPGQFVYQESTALELATGNDNDTAPWFRKVRYQQWQRADGAVPVYRRTTLLGVVPLRGGKVSSRTMQLARIDTGGRFLPCASQPTEPNAPYAAHAKLPTDPAPLRSALAARVDAGQRAELTQDQAVWVNLTGLVSAPTPSKVQAALFTVARQIKGARLSGGTTDAAGRPGLAVTFDARPGEREDLIFDAKTYRLLGHRSVWTGSRRHPALRHHDRRRRRDQDVGRRQSPGGGVHLRPHLPGRIRRLTDRLERVAGVLALRGPHQAPARRAHTQERARRDRRHSSA